MCWRFQRNLANFPEHTIHQLGTWRSGRPSLRRRPHLAATASRFTGMEVLKEKVYLPSTWCFISAWAAGLVEGLCPAHFCPLTTHRAKNSSRKLPVLLASGMCRTRAPGREWATAEPCCLGGHPSLLCSSTRARWKRDRLPGNMHSSLPPHLVSSAHTLISCLF